ncbi:hypothetical protein [Methylorubrum aminovorans]|uniref:hypothetical protein n=1 Tax=Methylorubrum aminovorans TaxID=269069 RepID=UPI003C2C8B39
MTGHRVEASADSVGPLVCDDARCEASFDLRRLHEAADLTGAVGRVAADRDALEESARNNPRNPAEKPSF